MSGVRHNDYKLVVSNTLTSLIHHGDGHKTGSVGQTHAGEGDDSYEK